MSDDFLREWGRNLEARREAAGLDRYELADAIGVRYQSVWRWEMGKVAPKDDHKLALARVLRTDVRTLFPLIVTEAAS